MPTPSLAALAAISLYAVATLGAWAWAFARIVRSRAIFPREEPPRVPWGEGSILAIVLLYLGWTSVCLAFVRPGSRGPLKLTGAEQMGLSAAINAGVLFLVPAVLALLAGGRARHLGLGGAGALRSIGWGVLGCLLATPAVYGVNALALLAWPVDQHPVEALLRSHPPARIVALTAVSAVVLAPAAEELVFRGVLLGWLLSRFGRDGGAWPQPGTMPARIHTGRWLPNVTTSLFFAIIHARWPDPIPLFVLSLGLGFMYRRTGSLLAPIAMHACFNGLSMAAVLLAVASGEAPRRPEPGPIGRVGDVSATGHEIPGELLLAMRNLFVMISDPQRIEGPGGGMGRNTSRSRRAPRDPAASGWTEGPGRADERGTRSRWTGSFGGAAARPRPSGRPGGRQTRNEVPRGGGTPRPSGRRRHDGTSGRSRFGACPGATEWWGVRSPSWARIDWGE